MKTWVKVLIIGIILLFIGMILAGNVMMTKQFQYGGIGWVLFFFGAILIIASIVAAAKRLFSKMLND
ncbi:MAG: hypothetical protein K5785_08375 [Nitrosarchaeum sp.]|nr:hypothetical protein [Nitrosarchaeum sp.]